MGNIERKRLDRTLYGVSFETPDGERIDPEAVLTSERMVVRLTEQLQRAVEAATTPSAGSPRPSGTSGSRRTPSAAQGGSRDMGNIERWTVRVCRECGEAYQHGEGCPFPGDYIMATEGELVEVVRADALQGAVDLLQALIDAGEAVSTYDVTGDDWAAWEQAVERARRIIGGQ